MNAVDTNVLIYAREPRGRDDGAGFDPGATSYGTGLQGMADRLDAIGGTLLVESSLGRGTIVRGRVPVLPGAEGTL